MIDEDTLAGLLADHAERIPVPETAVDSLLAASPSPSRPSPRHRSSSTTSRVLVSAATVVLALGGIWAYAARSDHGAGSLTVAPTGPRSAAAPTTARVTARATSGESRGLVDQKALRDAPGSRASSARKDRVADAGSLNVTSTPSPPSAFSGASYTVRTATLDLRVEPHGLGETIGRVTTIAASTDGFVADAHTTPPGTTPAGTVTIRVPSARFRATVEQLRGLGTVTGAGVRNIELARHYTRARGSVRAPDDTAYATITISVSEPDA